MKWRTDQSPLISPLGVLQGTLGQHFKLDLLIHFPDANCSPMKWRKSVLSFAFLILLCTELKLWNFVAPDEGLTKLVCFKPWNLASGNKPKMHSAKFKNFQ